MGGEGGGRWGPVRGVGYDEVEVGDEEGWLDHVRRRGLSSAIWRPMWQTWEAMYSASKGSPAVVKIILFQQDVLVEILVRLRLPCVVRCTLVSKAWRRLISFKSFPIARVSNLPITYLLCRRWCDDTPFLTPISKHIRSRSTSPRFTSNMSLPTKMTATLLPASPLSTWTPSQGNLRRRSEFSIFGSCNNGLILFWIRPKSFLIVNPSNQTWIPLPAPPICCLDYLHDSRHSRIFPVDLHIMESQCFQSLQSDLSDSDSGPLEIRHLLLRIPRVHGQLPNRCRWITLRSTPRHHHTKDRVLRYCSSMAGCIWVLSVK